MRWTAVDMTTEEYGFDELDTGCELVGPISRDDLLAAQRAVEALLVPLDPKKTVQLLTEVSYLTSHPAHVGDDAKGMVVAYAKRLLRYPGDLVEYVLETQPDRQKWFPSWQELVSRLDPAGRRRFLLRDAIARRLENYAAANTAA